jgi:hypothetical protein
MKKQRHTYPWVLGLGLALAPGCKGCDEGTTANQVANAPLTQAPAPRALQARKGPMPTELMADSTTPYAAGLFVDDQAVYLTTEKKAYRLVPGAKPLQIPIENGASAAMTRSDFVYWGQAALWKVSKLGGQPQRLADLKLQPAYIAASDDDFAWVVVPSSDRFEAQTLASGKVRTLYSNPGRIEAFAMEAGRVYFVHKDPQNSWRIGSVAIQGGDLRFAPPKTGPTPAKLATAGGVYHYDLDSGEIRKISPDLSRQEVITNKTICSPIAVAEKVFCPNMEGLWQLDRQPGAKAESVFPEPRRIPNLAANSKFITWLADAGPDRLSLMLLPLPLPTE